MSYIERFIDNLVTKMQNRHNTPLVFKSFARAYSESTVRNKESSFVPDPYPGEVTASTWS